MPTLVSCAFMAAFLYMLWRLERRARLEQSVERHPAGRQDNGPPLTAEERQRLDELERATWG